MASNERGSLQEGCLSSSESVPTSIRIKQYTDISSCRLLRSPDLLTIKQRCKSWGQRTEPAADPKTIWVTIFSCLPPSSLFSTEHKLSRFCFFLHIKLAKVASISSIFPCQTVFLDSSIFSQGIYIHNFATRTKSCAKLMYCWITE